MSRETFRKIAVRRLGPDLPATAAPISGEEMPAQAISHAIVGLRVPL